MGFFDKLFKSEVEAGEDAEGAEPEKGEAKPKPGAVKLEDLPESVVAFDQDRDEPHFDPKEILDAASVAEEAQALVKKAKELLNSLPEGTPREVEAQIVEAAFKAFDVPLDDILAAAKHEIKIFEMFIEEGRKHHEKTRKDGEQRIHELEAEISRIRADVAWSAEEQETLQAAAENAIANVQPVLEFFRVNADRLKSVPPPPKGDEDDDDDGDDDAKSASGGGGGGNKKNKNKNKNKKQAG